MDPQPNAPSETSPGAPPQRGGCLTAFLIAMMTINPATALFYFLGTDLLRNVLPAAPDWAFPVLGVLTLANTGFAFGLWHWQKWGVYGFLGMAALALVINFAVGVPPNQAIMGLGGPIILLLLVKPLWQHFR